MSRRRSAADWQMLIAEFESSAQTLAAFCIERSLNAGYFSRVRARLHRDESTGFVPVRLAAASRPVSIQIQDVTIRCESGTSSAWLLDLVSGLRA